LLFWRGTDQPTPVNTVVYVGCYLSVIGAVVGGKIGLVWQARGPGPHARGCQVVER
jgi:hypothetical protein